jgi:hypothetical protein
MSPLLRSGNPLRWIPGPFQQSPLRRGDPNPPPPSPQRTSAAIPATGSVGRRPLCQSRQALFHSLQGTPSGMLPHLAPGGAIERLPDHGPRQQRGEGPSRSCSTSIAASQPTRMILHFVPGQPVCLYSPSPHKLPLERPRPIGPKKETVQSEPGCNPRRLRLHRVVTAPFSSSGRKLSASIVPPGSWPRHPSTPRLSRSPQPSSRRIVQASPRPSSRRSPRHFAVASSGSAAVHARKTPCHIQTTTINQPTTQAPTPKNPQHYVLPLLDPAYSLRINQQGVRFAHVRPLPPCAVGPQGPGALLFTAARGSRA